MRVLIMSDMEGVSGIVTWQQVNGSPDPMYQEGRRLYTEEINAAVRGAKAAGPVAVDCHGAGECTLIFRSRSMPISTIATSAPRSKRALAQATWTGLTR